MVICRFSAEGTATGVGMAQPRRHRHADLPGLPPALKVLTPESDVVVTGLRLSEMTGERFIQSFSMSDDATRLRRKPFNLCLRRSPAANA